MTDKRTVQSARWLTYRCPVYGASERSERAERRNYWVLAVSFPIISHTMQMGNKFSEVRYFRIFLFRGKQTGYVLTWRGTPCFRFWHWSRLQGPAESAQIMLAPMGACLKHSKLQNRSQSTTSSGARRDSIPTVRLILSYCMGRFQKSLSYSYRTFNKWPINCLNPKQTSHQSPAATREEMPSQRKNSLIPF